MRVVKKMAILAVLLAATVGSVMAQDLDVETSATISPLSVPVDGSAGTIPSVPVLRLDLRRSPANGTLNQEVESITVELTGGALAADVTAVRVYFAEQDGVENDGVWDGPGSETEVGSATFVANPVTVTFATPLSVGSHNPNGTANLYVTFDVAEDADTTRAFGATVTDIMTRDAGTTGPYVSEGETYSTDRPSEIDSYEIGLVGSTPATMPASATPGDAVTALELDFSVADASLLTAGHAEIGGITLTRTGDALDTDARSVRVFADDGTGDPGNETYDSGDDTLYGTGTMSGGVVTINLNSGGNNPIRLSDGNTKFFVDITVGSDAAEGRTVGLQVANPATDIVFNDGIDDGIVDSTVYSTVEYGQIGYISSTDPTPDPPDTFTTEPTPDEEPPTVVSTSPADGVTGVDNQVTIEVTFSEGMAPIEAADVTIEGSSSGTIDPSLDGTFVFNTTTNQSFTFAKDTPFDFSETVTVTVLGTVTDDAVTPNALAGDGSTEGTDYVFSFTIEPNLPPTVLGWVPTADAVDVNVGTTVSVIFSEAMDANTVLDAANFSLLAEGSSEKVAGSMTYSADANTATFAPDQALEYATTYSATVTTGMTDNDGGALTEEVSISFTTAQEFPDFDEPIVTNNRIRPGSTDPVRIFVSTPSGFDGDEPVSIQVFTSTGRRVATLTTSGETFADVTARQPIVWDGTNGRGQELGPGLYFVQVLSGSYRRALRVLIVR